MLALASTFHLVCIVTVVKCHFSEAISVGDGKYATLDSDLVMTSADVILKCYEDTCPVGDLEKLKLASGYFPGRDKLWIDYKTNPYHCRCDDDCVTYNDCCYGRIINGTSEAKESVQKEHPWKCYFLEHHDYLAVWSLMKGQCPRSSQDVETNGLCAGDAKAIEKMPSSQKYLVDLPIYSNNSNVLYRNIFCARCHHESSKHILKHTLRLTCNKEFTPIQRIEFLARSKYIQGKRIWKYENITCLLSIEEFWNDNLTSNVPSVRYCGPPRLVQSCNPLMNATEKTRALCGSYTQPVTGYKNQHFKNPHCYACHTGWPVDGDPNDLECYNVMRMHDIGPSRDSVGGAGLNFLFDFNMFNENQWVGYDMLCDETEVWDYIRGTCHPMMCGIGHVLKDGACYPEVAEEPEHSTDTDSSEELHTDHNHEPTQDLVLEPECYRILLTEMEYSFSDEYRNGTLAVNVSTGEVIYLTPSEYEIWNETAVTICAKYLHLAFESRFSPVFNYLSVALVGLSLGFLFLHICLYLLLPKLRNLPANNLFCLTLSLFLGQFILLIFITATENLKVCITAAISIHYCFLAAFFWMNAMSFDIWRTFAGHSLMLHGRRGGSGGHGLFIKYACFGFGVPFVIVLLAVITDFGGKELDILESIQPGYGQTGLCWFSQRLPLFVFFALPVALVILSNFVLFSLTARAILKQNQENNRVLGGTKDSAKSNTPGKSSDEVLLKLYIKLALIMGLTWILGLVAAFVLWEWLWYAFVVLNGLQGTFIFFAFDFKRRTLGLIQERLRLKDRKVTRTSGEEEKGDMTRGGTSTSSTSLTTTVMVSTITKNRSNFATEQT